jgi:hypothetical protein
MKTKFLGASVAALAMVVGGVGCTAKPPTSKPPTAPTTISGEGRYAFDVWNGGATAIAGDNPATTSLVRTGAVYSGTVLSHDCVDLCPQGYFEITVDDHTFTNLYTRDANEAPGVGFEMTTTNIVATRNTTDCTGDGLDITFTGGYTVGGVYDPAWDGSNATITLCNTALADWFAPLP